MPPPRNVRPLQFPKPAALRPLALQKRSERARLFAVHRKRPRALQRYLEQSLVVLRHEPRIKRLKPIEDPRGLKRLP